MRLKIRFELERAARLPLDHQDLLTGLVYRLLGESDAQYASFLHDEGYRLEEGGNRRYKLFVFSTLRVPKGRRRVEESNLRITPGVVEWLLSSPREDFLTHSATGLFAVGQTVNVGHVPLTIAGIECLPEPEFRSPMRFTCLTPIVASVPREDRSTRYLVPRPPAPNPGGVGPPAPNPGGEGPGEFSEAVRRNLVRKYELVTGRPPSEAESRLELAFDADYLARASHGGTKLTTYKGIQIRGAFAPFTLTGSESLIRMAWECGLGEKNSAGFGMIEVAK